MYSSVLTVTHSASKQGGRNRGREREVLEVMKNKEERNNSETKDRRIQRKGKKEKWRERKTYPTAEETCPLSKGDEGNYDDYQIGHHHRSFFD